MEEEWQSVGAEEGRVATGDGGGGDNGGSDADENVENIKNTTVLAY